MADGSAKTLDECRKLIAAGRVRESIPRLEALLASEPANVQVLHYFAVALHLTGRSLEAIAYFDRALELEPLQGNLHLNRSTALLAGGRLGDAIESAREAVRLRPEVPAAYVGLALAECRAARYADAWETVSRGLEQAPDHPGLLNQAAHIATEARNLPLAESYMARAMEHAPNNPEVIFNSGVLHQVQSRREEALRAYDRTLASQPHHAGAFANRAIVLRSLGRISEAMRQFRNGLARQPDWPILRYNLALTELLVGNWEKAWPDFDLRMKLEGPRDGSTKPESPLWDGSDISNETLLVMHEQGLGETLQFLRFLPFARRKATRVIFMCQERLHPLLSRLDLFRGGDIELLSDSVQIPPHGVHVPLMSLARLCGSTQQSIPQLDARIMLEEPRLSQWAAFGRRDARSWRIGLAWQENPDAGADRDRAMPFAQFAALGALSDRATFISLQKHLGHDQPIPEGMAIPPADFDTGRDAFLDSAALLQSLDLVITTDTAAAHLGGLLGRPVWLLLNFVPDWCWGLEGTLTGWYPTMRIFRQPALGDWSALMTDVAAQLGRLVGEAGEGRHDPQRLNSHAMAILAGGQRGQRAAETALPMAGHVVAMNPGQADLWSNFSVLLDRLGRAADSRRALRFALTAEPGHVPSRVALAKKLSAVGKASEALAMLRDVLARDPDIAATHSAMAVVLSDLKRYKSAEAAARQALEIEPKNARLWVQLGSIQSDAGRHRQAAESWERALVVDPGSADAFSNLCANERNFGEVEIACWYGERAVECDSTDADTWSNFGVAELEAGRQDHAIQALRKAIEIRGDHADAHLALGMALLSRGDFTAGFKHYEARLASRKLGIAAARPNLPFWRGGDPKGLAILLMTEQGLGDAFQFVRYARWLKERGSAKIYVGCPKRIAHLLGTVPGVDGVITQGDKLPDVDVMAYMMSMPLLTGMQAETIPSFDSYIDADSERVTRWAEWLAERPGCRVGIAWQGNPDSRLDKDRSFPLVALEPLARLPNVRLISLQKGAGEEQGEALAGRFEIEHPGPDFDAGPDAFADTAALIMNLDLVVTSDNAVAHLAGALGKPCWVIFKANPEWRWLSGRFDSPWYPKTRLFRRVRDEVEDAPFSGLMGRVTSALEKLVAGDHDQRALPDTIDVRPFDAAATYNAALKAHRAKDDATAAPLFAAVLKVPKMKPLALKMLGTLALHADRNYRAAGFFDGAERAGLDAPEFLTNYAISLRRIGDSDGAIRKLEAAIAKSPTPEAHLTLANIHRDAGHFESSLTNYRASIALSPEFAKAHRGLANLMRDMHRPEDSLAAFERAREIAPKDPNLILDHAHAKLFAGEFIGGFRDYEYRWQGKELRPRDFAEPRWNGEVAPGKVLLIHGEQGFGDNIQFVRFVDEAARRVGRVILEVRGPLVDLMKNLETERPLTVMEQGRPVGKFDLQIPMMSLPMALGTTLGTVPPPLHFRLAPEHVAAWRGRLPPEGIRIGLVWQGNPKAKADAGRSPPFSALTPLFSLPGAHFVALQKTDGLEQLRRSGFADRITAPGEALGDFLETAHAIAALDLVVSSCTATLHLAATMGVPVYGMLKYHADWRWLNELDASPWYPSLRLFRQHKPGEWEPVVMAIRATLAERMVVA